MGHIFISYSRRDSEIVDRFISELVRIGLDVWIDREDIKVGNIWRVQIVEAIDTCDAFVLVLSHNSATSENVRKEIDLAQDSSRKLFVLMLERITVPAALRYQLAGLQFADVPEYGFEVSSQGLAKAVKEYVNSTVQTQQTANRLEVELVIQGVNLASFNKAKQEELLEFIAKLADVNKSQLSIENMAAGSVHVFVETPASTAFSLKTMALNHDRRFKEENISALRLKGNRRFIKISTGILTFATIAAFVKSQWTRIFLGSCSCLICLVAAGVLAWQSSHVGPPPSEISFASRLPPKTIISTEPTIPTNVMPVTGPSVTDQPGCHIAITSTFAYQGPGRAYNVSSYERYVLGQPFKVLMSDRSGKWVYGVLPDDTKGWLSLDWLAGRCYSPAVPTASYIAPPPRTIPTHRTPRKYN